jgi:site-specific DNA-methyltransferase (adenine-specific)
MNNNIIYNECCLLGLPKLLDHSIDLICADLPYGRLFGQSKKWKSPIDLTELWIQYKRVLKKTGTIILFGQQPFTSVLVSSNYPMFKYSLVWVKSIAGGFAQAPYKILCQHEDILVFSHGGTTKNSKNKMTYNPQGIIPCYKMKHGKNGKTSHRQNRHIQQKYLQTVTNYPRSILHFNNDSKTIHPTQKPIKLLEYLIKTFSNENDIILDNCMGSGSTAIACINTNRNFIGFEVDENYYKMSLYRLKQHKFPPYFETQSEAVK